MAAPRLGIPILLALLPAACAWPQGAHRAPTPEPRLLEEPLAVHVRERFYPVEGVSASRINVDLAGRGPAHGGRRWHAVTDFEVRWRYVARRRGGRCTAEEVSLQVEIVTTLPRWEDRGRAGPELASDWDLYLDRLRDHEAGHQRIVVNRGRRLLEWVEGLDAPDCATLEHLARRLERVARRDVDAAHDAWDRATAHGMAGS